MVGVGYCGSFQIGLIAPTSVRTMSAQGLYGVFVITLFSGFNGNHLSEKSLLNGVQT